MSAPRSRWRRWCLAAALAALCTAALAIADGGAVVCSQRLGDLRVTVLMSPARPEAGPVEFSVLVRDAEGAPRSDISVVIDATHEPSARHISSAATAEASRNSQLASAWLDLAQSGEWEVRVRLEPGDATGTGDSVVAFHLPVAQPAPTGIPWNWLCAAGIGLFVLVWRECLLRRQVPR